MGKVVDFRKRHRKHDAANVSRFVTCAYCRERHPFIRLSDGSRRCLSAFEDGERWFCRNRGCRAAWLERHGRR